MSRIGSLKWLISFLVLLTTACQANLSTPEKEELTLQNIQEALQNNPETIDFATVTTFEWDEMFIFEPYTSFETINEQVPVKLSKKDIRMIEYQEGFFLLIFIKENQVVQIIEYPRNLGDPEIQDKNHYFQDAAEVDLHHWES